MLGGDFNRGLLASGIEAFLSEGGNHSVCSAARHRGEDPIDQIWSSILVAGRVREDLVVSDHWMLQCALPDAQPPKMKGYAFVGFPGCIGSAVDSPLDAQSWEESATPLANWRTMIDSADINVVWDAFAVDVQRYFEARGGLEIRPGHTS